jgi:ubiquinone/menaquinone biosynthesis C-methylase UbiE
VRRPHARRISVVYDGAIVTTKTHWNDVYGRKRAEEVSWFRPHLDISLGFIRAARLDRDARIVDVGGGASTFVDDLLALGHTNVAVADIAESALEVAKRRLGPRARDVDWLVGDVTSTLLPPASVDFWHDRAVFHFLVNEDSRAAYLRQVRRSVKPGGHVLVATFGLDGPDKCSGLPTARYDATGIKAVFGDVFTKIGEAAETHETPWGSEQAFVYCFCVRAASP